MRTVQKTPPVGLSIVGEVLKEQPGFLRTAASLNAHGCYPKKIFDVSPHHSNARIFSTMGLMREQTGSFKLTLGGQLVR